MHTAVCWRPRRGQGDMPPHLTRSSLRARAGPLPSDQSLLPKSRVRAPHKWFNSALHMPGAMRGTGTNKTRSLPFGWGTTCSRGQTHPRTGFRSPSSLPREPQFRLCPVKTLNSPSSPVARLGTCPPRCAQKATKKSVFFTEKGRSTLAFYPSIFVLEHGCDILRHSSRVASTRTKMQAETGEQKDRQEEPG